MTIAWIALFGMAGVLARYGCGVATAGLIDQTLPIATFGINVLGSFLIGAAYAAGIERSLLSEPLRLGIMVGFLGGFTTFSSFSLETARLVEMNRPWQAFFYVAASAFLGVSATFAGLAVGRRFLGT